LLWALIGGKNEEHHGLSEIMKDLHKVELKKKKKLPRLKNPVAVSSTMCRPAQEV
jgi:hypothetical protein